MNRRRAIAGGIFLLVAACNPKTRSFGHPEIDSDASDGDCQTGDSSCDSGSVWGHNDQVDVAPDLDAARVDDTELSGLKVAIDVGHSAKGSDRGAFGGDISEYDLNVLQANYVARELRRRGASVSLFHYPETTELEERGRNAAGHQILISIHHNSFTEGDVQGTEVLIDSSTQRKSDQTLASLINKEIVDHLWLSHERAGRNRGAKAQRLGVLRHAPQSVVAKCLTESFFISERHLTLQEARAMTQKAAEGIVLGVVSHYSKSQSKMLSELDTSFIAWPEDADTQDLYEGH